MQPTSHRPETPVLETHVTARSIVRRWVIAVLSSLGLLVLFGSGTAFAQFETPSANAIGTAPGCIAISWEQITAVLSGKE